MQTTNRIGRYIAFAACIILLTFLSQAPNALAREMQTVRVGFFAFDGYHMQDDSGTRYGYGYEWLQRMAGYTDWQYEYVGYDKGWNEMQTMLENGEIDLLTSAQKTPEREEKFAFSESPIGTSSAILTVRSGDTRYLMEDYQNWSGMRIGMLRGNTRNESFARFASQNGFTYLPEYFESTNEMVSALKEKNAIDAILTSNLRSIRDEWVLAQFDASPFYIMVRKGNAKLLEEIKYAIAQLDSDEPGLRTRLMNKYYTPDSGVEIDFTAQERAYIEKMRGTTFTALLNPDRAPLSAVEDGKPSGILADIAAEVIDRSGLSIEFVQVENRETYRQLMESGDIDICFDAGNTYAFNEALGYRLTNPYFNASVSRLYRQGAKELSSVAMVRGSDLARKFGVSLCADKKHVVYYDSIDEVVSAVLTGKQDMAYLYRRCADLAAQKDVTNRLIVESIYGYTHSFSIAVKAEQESLLYSILARCVSSIGEDWIEETDRMYTLYSQKPFSIAGLLYDNPYLVIGTIAVFFLLVTLSVCLYFNAKMRAIEHEKYIKEQRQSELLKAALASAESAGESKSRFLSNISHEMRTPLNAILGMLYLSEHADARQADAYRANMNASAKQLLALINDVLDMSSIESGKLKLAREPFDFRGLIHAVTNQFLAQCKQKGVSYETRIVTPTQEKLVGDSLRVTQILNNLLSNAVKFTDKGHVWLTIRQTETRENQVFLRFEVSDTGCGMTDDMRARLFQPFEQEDPSTASRHGGSGLGLSIVKNLVTMMGGAIRVESKKDEGSVFTVDLPFEKDAARQAERTGDISRAGEARVLAVDDDPTERAYIDEVLKNIRISHTCVSSGEEALRALEQAEGEQKPYDICLIDWKMPNMNGLETTRRIRETYSKDVVVIVVSAYANADADIQAKEAGANWFLSKPLFQSSLLDLFMTLTQGRLAERESAVSMPQFHGKRVLLAEDNAMNRLVAEGLLRKFGVACDYAQDGAVARDMFEKSEPGRYDAILMDIQMPNMNGFEATAAIRKMERPDAKTIPIIALTANAFTEDVAKTLSSGMNAHVAKPIEPDALAAALRSAFDTGKELG